MDLNQLDDRAREIRAEMKRLEMRRAVDYRGAEIMADFMALTEEDKVFLLSLAKRLKNSVERN